MTKNIIITIVIVRGFCLPLSPRRREQQLGLLAVEGDRIFRMRLCLISEGVRFNFCSPPPPPLIFLLSLCVLCVHMCLVIGRGRKGEKKRAVLFSFLPCFYACL